MKSSLLLLFLLLLKVSHAAEVEVVFAIRDLKGDTQIYTGVDGSLLTHPEKSEDSQSNTIYIQREKGEGKDVFFVVHNNGRQRVIPISGKKSMTFLEAYGDNNFLWTVYLDKKDENGAYLAVCASVKAKGVLDMVSSSVMSGRAYPQ